MKDEFENLQELIARNKMDAAFAILTSLSKEDPEMHNQVLILSARYNDVHRKENLGLISSGEASVIRNQVNYAVLDLIKEYKTTIAVTPGVVEEKQKRVFISYNHNDSEIAHALKERLTAKNIRVIIDTEKMQAGEDIKQFIENSVRDTDTTISIVSKKSLLSAWVAMETINTYYHEKTNSNKKFIPCYIEDDFFDRNFTDTALDFIDKELETIEALRKARSDKGRDTRDLNNEYTRLKELSNGMDEIIRRLRESLCIDIRGENLDKNLNKIVDRING